MNNPGIMRTGAFAEPTLHTQHPEIAINLGVASLSRARSSRPAGAEKRIAPANEKAKAYQDRTSR